MLLAHVGGEAYVSPGRIADIDEFAALLATLRTYLGGPLLADHAVSLDAIIAKTGIDTTSVRQEKTGIDTSYDS